MAAPDRFEIPPEMRAFAEKSVEQARQAFELGEQLVKANDIQEVMKLQADYIKRQLQVFSEQARELGESAGSAARDTATPKGGT